MYTYNTIFKVIMHIISQVVRFICCAQLSKKNWFSISFWFAANLTVLAGFYSFFSAFLAELYYDRGNHHEFTSLVRELARPGELSTNVSYDFEFNQVEKPYESYTGTNVKLRWFSELQFYLNMYTVCLERNFFRMDLYLLSKKFIN